MRSDYECNQTIARELYVAPVPRVYRIHVEAQAMQAARGVAAPASTRGMGGHGRAAAALGDARQYGRDTVFKISCGMET